ncbi:hypothetical protein DMB66_59320, partial [Actinoplanes sp. ATCC 53533]
MTAREFHVPAKVGRRAILILALSSLTAASAHPGSDDQTVTQLLPAEPPAPRRSVGLKSVAHWTSIFMQSWDHEYKNSLPMSRSADSWDHYNLSYSVDACTAMFRATDQRSYLDRALAFVENVADAAVLSSTLRSS